jgi:hypothetical protein
MRASCHSSSSEAVLGSRRAGVPLRRGRHRAANRGPCDPISNGLDTSRRDNNGRDFGRRDNNGRDGDSKGGGDSDSGRGL